MHFQPNRNSNKVEKFHFHVKSISNANFNLVQSSIFCIIHCSNLKNVKIKMHKIKEGMEWKCISYTSTIICGCCCCFFLWRNGNPLDLFPKSVLKSWKCGSIITISYSAKQSLWNCNVCASSRTRHTTKWSNRHVTGKTERKRKKNGNRKINTHRESGWANVMFIAEMVAWTYILVHLIAFGCPVTKLLTSRQLMAQIVVKLSLISLPQWSKPNAIKRILYIYFFFASSPSFIQLS